MVLFWYINHPPCENYLDKLHNDQWRNKFKRMSFTSKNYYDSCVRYPEKFWWVWWSYSRQAFSNIPDKNMVIWYLKSFRLQLRFRLSLQDNWLIYVRLIYSYNWLNILEGLNESGSWLFWLFWQPEHYRDIREPFWESTELQFNLKS